MRSLHCGKVRCSYRMAKWGFDMINREEHKRLLEELERLKAENEKLRKEVDMFQRKTAGIYE